MRLLRLVDEVALAGEEHLDPNYVAGYERRAAFDPSGDLDELRSRGLGAESTLVDLGAGTGVMALAAAEGCRRVIAVDISPAMVDAVRASAVERGLDNVECVQAGFLSYTHRGEPADVVYTRNALHHLPDFWKALALEQVSAVLRPGGILRVRDLVFSFEPHEAEAPLAAWLDAAAATSPEEGWTRSELEVHLRDEHSTFTWLLEPMLERAGFEILAAEYEHRRIHAAYTCVKRAR